MAMRLSHAVIRSLYETLRWYSDHRGAPEAARVLQLFETWRGLHASFINISKEGWDALRRLAHNLQLQIGSRDDEWLFLFAVETYLNLAIRAITLAKLGRAATNVRDFAEVVKEDETCLRAQRLRVGLRRVKRFGIARQLAATSPAEH
jgi:hypothetical protein